MGNIITFRAPDADALKLKIATSNGDRHRVKNLVWTWKQLRERLERPDVDPLTLAQFKSLPEDKQSARKNNGYFVGAQFAHGIRRKPLMRDRFLITFDVDECTTDLLAELELGTSGLGDIEYVVYSTRKHTAEKPRIRIVIPLAVPLAPDKFIALSRILAQKLDPSMMTVDPVSFREAQIMYWPSVCSDQRFFYLHNRGAVCDPDTVLNAWGAWENIGNLPHSDREGKVRDTFSGTKGDPRAKQNIIGAFCIEYDIHQAIETFLAGVYEPSEHDALGVPTRYTYKPGSSTNGVVVYDDGYSLTSHHGTDPVGGERAVNPFDLVRIHEFGDLDKNLDASETEKDNPVKLPSYLAMVEFINEKLPNVMSRLRSIRYSEDDADEMAEDEDAELVELPDADDDEDNIVVDEPAPPVDPAADWRELLDMNSEGIVKPTLHNLRLILKHDKRYFRGRLAFDIMLMEPVYLKDTHLPKLGITIHGRNDLNPRSRMSDLHYISIRAILEAPRKFKGWGLRVTDRDLREAVAQVASENPTHAIQVYLEGLPDWDGVPRVERFWTTYCGSEDTAYTRNVARVTLVGAVARAFEPGCKYDFAVILEGDQGTGKSSLVAALGGRLFTAESEGHFDSQTKFVESTVGFWFIEIPELVSFGKAEIENIKATMARRSDHVRLAYERTAKTYCRSSIIFGTTNQRDYLRDTTGNRRFWPIACGPGALDVAGVDRDRDQIWAEALMLYRNMRKSLPVGDLPLYITDPWAAEQAKKMQASRMAQDRSTDNAGLISHWLDKPVPAGQEDIDAPEPEPFDDDDAPGDLVHRIMACGIQIWEHVFNGTKADYGQKGGSQIREAMKHVPGWTQAVGRRRTKRYGEVRVYSRVSDPENDL